MRETLKSKLMQMIELIPRRRLSMSALQFIAAIHRTMDSGIANLNDDDVLFSCIKLVHKHTRDEDPLFYDMINAFAAYHVANLEQEEEQWTASDVEPKSLKL